MNISASPFCLWHISSPMSRVWPGCTPLPTDSGWHQNLGILVLPIIIVEFQSHLSYILQSQLLFKSLGPCFQGTLLINRFFKLTYHTDGNGPAT